MEKPSFTFSPWGLTFLLGIFLFAGTSCVQGTLNLNFQTLTTGTVDFTYVVDPMLQGAFRSEQTLGQNPANLPITLAEWQRAVSRVSEGLSLISFTSNLTPLGWDCRVQLRFTSARGLEGIFIALGLSFTYLINSGVWTLNYRWQLPPVQILTPRTRSIVRTLYEYHRINFRIQAPRPITSINQGVLSTDRRQWNLSQSVSGLLEATEPQDFQIQW